MQWLVLDIAPTTTMGVPKYINSVMCPSFRQFYKKVVVREHGDVIETQTMKVCPPQFFSKLGLCPLWNRFVPISSSKSQQKSSLQKYGCFLTSKRKLSLYDWTVNQSTSFLLWVLFIHQAFCHSANSVAAIGTAAKIRRIG